MVGAGHCQCLVTPADSDGPARSEGGEVGHVRSKSPLARGRRVPDLRLGSLLQSSHVGVWAVDKRSRTTFANRRVAELLGCPLDDVGAVPFPVPVGQAG